MSELTRDQIEKWREFFETVSWLDLDMPHLNALCNMALAWLEVQPRPLSELPTDDKQHEILVLYKGAKKYRLQYMYGGFSRDSGIYIPLSSLPEPK